MDGLLLCDALLREPNVEVLPRRWELVCLVVGDGPVVELELVGLVKRGVCLRSPKKGEITELPPIDWDG